MKNKKELLRFTTAGSVDDGKSTLIGRLLFDSKSIFIDQYESIKNSSERRGEEEVNLALLTDGLKAEREQGITIDVAYRYFSTPRRKFIIADTPGHIQYTRNMVTGASTANVALILIDVRKDIGEQTKRHAIISALLQIPHLVICINKMDLEDYSEKVYDEIKEEFEAFSNKLDVKDITFIPISALYGDNVVRRSENMSWYEGPTLIYYLENVHIGSDHNFIDCRFPIQHVIRPNTDEYHDFRGYAGRIASGTLRPGEEITLLPSGFTSTISALHTFDGEVDELYPPNSAIVLLEDDYDLSRGDMLVKPNNMPEISQDIDAMICWFNETPLHKKKRYTIFHTTREAGCLVRDIRYKLDVNTLHKNTSDLEIGMNDIARVQLRTTQPLFTDAYRKNRTTGSFIIIDDGTNETIGAGMII